MGVVQKVPFWVTQAQQSRPKNVPILTSNWLSAADSLLIGQLCNRLCFGQHKEGKGFALVG